MGGGEGPFKVPSGTSVVSVQQKQMPRLNRDPREKQFIKIKIFHRSFLLKSLHAVNNQQSPFSPSGGCCLPLLMKKRQGLRVSGDPSERATCPAPRIGPAAAPESHAWDRVSPAAAPQRYKPTLSPGQLPGRQRASRPRAAPGAGGPEANSYPTLTIAALLAAAAPEQRWAPSGRRRQVQTSPRFRRGGGGGGPGHRRRSSAALNNGRLGRALRHRTRASAASEGADPAPCGGRPGCESWATTPPGPGVGGRTRAPRPPRPLPQGPLSLGARSQVIPQEAFGIGPGAQGGFAFQWQSRLPKV